jgi:hypothetical protein
VDYAVSLGVVPQQIALVVGQLVHSVLPPRQSRLGKK